MANVEEKIFLARVAEQAERFEDMGDFLEEVLVAKGGSVNPDERNLLSVAFKNLISSKRAACRTISAIEQNPKYSKFNTALLGYKTQIEEQLMQDCEKIIQIINKMLYKLIEFLYTILHKTHKFIQIIRQKIFILYLI